MTSSSRINMAAVAARMAAEEAEDRKGLIYDAGELRSRDLAVVGNISGMMMGGGGSMSAAGDSITTGGGGANSSASAATPSKARGRLWDAQRMDGATSPAAAAGRNSILASPLMASRSGVAHSSSSPAEERGGGGKAGETRRKMLALRAAVVDSLDVLSAQREDSALRMRTLQANTARNNDEALAAIAAFDTEFVFTERQGRDVAAVMAEADTALRMPFFDEFGLPVRIPSEEVISSRLAEASGRLLSDAESAQLCLSLRRDITAQFFPTGDHLIPELICAVNKFTKTDVVKAVTELLAKHDATIASLDAAIAAAEEAARVAVAKEDFAEAERLTGEVLTLSGRRTDTRAVQLILLAGDDDDDGTKEGSANGKPSTTSAAGFVKALDHLLYGTAIPTLRGEKQQLLETAKADAVRLATNHARVLKENSLSIARYNLASAESVEAMKANHAAQSAIWDKVRGLMEELEAVGAEGEALAKKHVAATDEEQRRRQDHREYLDSYRRHAACLEDLQKNGEAALSFLERVHAAFQTARKEVEASGVEDQLQAILTRQRKAYHAAFKHFGLGSNTHVARFDQRVSNCEHLLKELEFAFSEAPRVGDAEKNGYARRVADIGRRRRSAADKSDDFVSAYAVREDQFADITVRVQASQRSREEKRAAGVVVTGARPAGVPPPAVDDASEEGELLALLRGSRAEALQARLDRISAVASRNAASVEDIRQRQIEAEGRLAVEEDKQRTRKLNASGLSPMGERPSSAAGAAKIDEIAHKAAEASAYPKEAAPVPLA